MCFGRQLFISSFSPTFQWLASWYWAVIRDRAVCILLNANMLSVDIDCQSESQQRSCPDAKWNKKLFVCKISRSRWLNFFFHFHTDYCASGDYLDRLSDKSLCKDITLTPWKCYNDLYARPCCKSCESIKNESNPSEYKNISFISEMARWEWVAGLVWILSQGHKPTYFLVAKWWLGGWIVNFVNWLISGLIKSYPRKQRNIVPNLLSILFVYVK